MKKIISLALAMLLLLSLAACGSTPETETPAAEEPAATAEPTPEPTPTEPEWEPGVARAANGELVYTTLKRGDIINVIGEWKDYYIIEGDEVDLLILKEYVRLDSDGEYESWTGYAHYGTVVYDNVHLLGEVIAELDFNQQVTVIDGHGDWLYIEWEGGSGYVDKEYISPYYISVGGGGGSSSGGGGGGGAVTGDINLGLVAYFGPAMDELKEMAMVLADGVDAYLCIAQRGDELKVTSATEEECEIYLEGFYAKVPRWLMHMEGDEEYESWTGYAYYGSALYEEYQMRNVLQDLSFNQEIKVIDELPTCYVVEIDDQIGYMDLEDLSEYYIVVGGGGGGGSSSGGGGGGGGWTAPII